MKSSKEGAGSDRARRETFSVLILRPSRYDDDGYVLRYLRGVLPSNTIAVLSALTRQVAEAQRLGANTRVRVVPLDDTVQAIDVRRLARRHLGPRRRAVVAFAGVQTNQFPRASDLALRFKAAGFEVMMGGFHVSGSIALARETPPECAVLMEHGVTLVKGEVENVWGDLLEAAFEERLERFYDISEKPDISQAPLPLVNMRYQKRFVYSRMATIDTSRGCPFNCSFCTIINVQGRRMRCRSADAILRQVKENYRRCGTRYYFFTDDNFARNRNWEAILDGLADLRQRAGLPISFMMQVDTQAWKLPRFVEKASRAGCTQVFLGVESLNPENLEAADKKQNHVEDIAQMLETWRAAGCACHAGYIVGFPKDTPESVAADVESLKQLGFDQCSFFMLTPLPGSADHAKLAAEGAELDPDLNNYDSCHETMRVAGFQPGEWLETYRRAWQAFCNPEAIKAVLARCGPRTYWGMLKNYMWYRNAIHEGIHPMISGLWRVKPRTERRPGFEVEGRLRHAGRRLREGAQTLVFWGRLFLELQDLWLQTRIRPGMRRWMDAQASGDLSSFVNGHLSGLRGAKCRLEAALAVRLIDWRIWARRRRRDGMRCYTTSRQQLNAYWRRLWQWIRELRVVRLAVETPRIGWNLLREVRYAAAFLVFFLREITVE